MLKTSLQNIKNKQQLRPYFYVNVTDIDTIKQEPFYLACKFYLLLFNLITIRVDSGKLKIKALLKEYLNPSIFYTICT